MYASDPSNPPFELRAIPWWTDHCSDFINNLLKWYPQTQSHSLQVLEFGGGNSSLYWLAKGLKVLVIENNDRYIQYLTQLAAAIGTPSKIITIDEFHPSLFDDYPLLTIKAQWLSDIPDVLDYSWDIIVNDSMSRDAILTAITQQAHLHQSIVILDNVEFCANWGRLDRSSARPEVIQAFRAFLRHPDWQHYSFEQAEGRSGHSQADKWGKETPHRWISTVAWHHCHVLHELMITQLGFPITNLEGIANQDLQHLPERCAFDPQTNRWSQKRFPDSLDLGLDRSFE